MAQFTGGIRDRNTSVIHDSVPNRLTLIAFVKERFHNAVEIDILGIFEWYSSLQIWPPKKIFQGRNYSGRMT